VKIIKSSSKEPRGFTLIELLVVIAIIAILAAILFPVFAKVREKARQITCVSNMKELGLGMMQYIQDNDEKYPGGFTPGAAGSASAYIDTTYFPLTDQVTAQATDNGNGDQWAQQIYAYVKSKGVYVCPDDTSSTQVLQSYAFNYNLAGQSESILTAPASTINLFESIITAPYPGSDPSTFNAYSAATIMDFNQDFVGTNIEPGVGGLASSPAGTDRHTNGDNWLAADGHVKFLVPSQVSFGGTPLKPGCTQYYGSSGPGCGQEGSISATSTDTMLLQDGVSKVQLTWSTL